MDDNNHKQQYLKIAMCQMNVVDNKDENLKKAEEMILYSLKDDPDLIVLPEMFNCPYDNLKFIEYAENRNNSCTLNFISKIAKKHKIYIVAGSIPEFDNGKIYNSSFVFDFNGKIIACHRKIHLFDIDVKNGVYFKESDTLSAGNEITVVKTEFGKIGIAICYDVRFPELSRLMVDKGANILIFPGAFNLNTGPVHWELLFKSRALDNQVFTLGVAPALNNENDYKSYGHSIICSPWGNVLIQGDYNEELLIYKIDLTEIKRIREELPLLKHRREDIYSICKK
ncbi:MAG: carbon-nitrogen hydrolase family protein [Methanobrevibacter sp.]|jgi:predicted amidohydrolase|nr:carbon-nitrogen hydrolase family protein [Candidatus Methanoflexus mossambicus]